MLFCDFWGFERRIEGSSANGQESSRCRDRYGQEQLLVVDLLPKLLKIFQSSFEPPQGRTQNTKHSKWLRKLDITTKLELKFHR